ncbi:MAG TPA: twin-arginine translocase subunit TatC [Verrucomicrobiota bacterium]|nr:twin-arginine translocase subunit TatC [Verrucomicrobiota bacterium]
MANESEVVRPDPEPEEEGGPVKPFLEHLEDLRWVIIRCLVSLGAGMVVCVAGAKQVMAILQWPLERSGIHVRLDWLNPLGGVASMMKIALCGGITVALPFILYFIADYVVPALTRKERKYFRRALVVGAGLFLAGIVMCYFLVLPISLKGLAAFNEWLGIETQLWRAEDYISLVTMFMIGMGLSFEFPVVLLTLVRLGVIPHEWLVKGRRYFFVINLVVICFITPDFISSFFIIVPVQLLFEVCVLISRHWEREKLAAVELLPARPGPTSLRE